MKTPVLYEFFAGTRSIWKVAESAGLKVLSLEKDPKFGCELTMDFLDFEPESHPVPDFLWFSPPCTSFSVVAWLYHRDKEWNAKTEEALVWDRIMERVRVLIAHYVRLNPKLVWFVENPRGRLQKLAFADMEQFKKTVTYCQYGDFRMKPTNIWTNSPNWIPKPMCKRGDGCHERAWRCSQGWTQSLWNHVDRSRIPKELCESVIRSMVDFHELAESHTCSSAST